MDVATSPPRIKHFHEVVAVVALVQNSTRNPLRQRKKIWNIFIYLQAKQTKLSTKIPLQTSILPNNFLLFYSPWPLTKQGLWWHGVWPWSSFIQNPATNPRHLTQLLSLSTIKLLGQAFLAAFPRSIRKAWTKKKGGFSFFSMAHVTGNMFFFREVPLY